MCGGLARHVIPVGLLVDRLRPSLFALMKNVIGVDERRGLL